ncbi:hypothetical protein [Bacillus cereus]|nr:hypothetical protein [Bacillus cereus]
MKFIFSSLHFLACISLININNIAEMLIGKEHMEKDWLLKKLLFGF